MNDSLTIKDLITAASPLIKSLVDTFVAPKLKSFKEKINSGTSIGQIPQEENFTSYFHRTFKKLAVVNTLVFNNSQRFLNEIYQPLTLVSTKDEKLKSKINGFPSKLSDEFGNILITDTAGMGKSTLMKKIFIDVIYANIGIPIFIELRRLTRDKKIIDEIQEQLNSLDKKFSPSILIELLVEGGFILILDGYDEIALIDKDIVTKDIQDFITKASNNRFFITSRPEKALSSFGNFQEFSIEPLTKKEAFELLRKYDTQGPVSSLLIKKLQEKELATIEEFLTNPLLVSLLFTAFEHKQAIPFKKYLFYRQVYDANFENHDLTKGDSYTHDKYSRLEIDDFHKILRHVGFTSFKLQKIEFTKDELLKLITDSKNFCVGLNFSESDFLLDILKTVPLFSQDGNYYRWSHKSLQEYFAAQFIYLDSKEKQTGILTKLYHHPSVENFVNVLDLYYDMDYKAFRNIIEYDLLKNYFKYFNQNYQANYQGVLDEDVKKRIELTYLSESYLFKSIQKKNEPHFSDKRLANMLQQFRKDNNIEADRFSGILINPSVNNNLFLIHYTSPQAFIFELLYNKKNDVVYLTLGDRENVKSISIDYEIKNEYEMHQINDDTTIGFNQNESFKMTNILISFTKLQHVTLNHEKALKKLELIEKSINDEKENDLILDGI